MTDLPGDEDSLWRLSLSAVLYWLLLIAFLFSYILAGNSISLVLTADRIVDAVGMSIALVSHRVIKMPPNAKFTYGYHRFESISSVIMIIAFVSVLCYSGYISYENISLRLSPSSLDTAVASIISIAVLPVISKLLSGNKSLPARTMSIHTLQDIITSVIALVASLILLVYRMVLIEFLSSLTIIVLSIYLNRNIMVRNLRLLMEGTELDTEVIEKELKKKFRTVHHLHIWDVCRHYRVATVHIYADRDSRLSDLDSIRAEISKYLITVGINHLTVQFESLAK